MVCLNKSIFRKHELLEKLKFVSESGAYMAQVLDLNRPVRDLINEYPEAAEIMKELGFESIINPSMLNTVGRFMTIKKVLL